MILQKYISQSGFCSRRKATDLILQKKVKVNGKIAEAGSTVLESDRVEINGKMLNLENKLSDKIYLLVNKPVGYVCTNRQFDSEMNIFELLPTKVNGIARSSLFVVGRLDKNSRGLVILTNDGDFAYKLTHPKYEVPKIYEVVLEETGTSLEAKNIIEHFKKGIDIGEGDGIAYAKNIIYTGPNHFRITLTQGKKRQIRRMFHSLGLRVQDLKRISIGKYKLPDDLKSGGFISLLSSQPIL